MSGTYFWEIRYYMDKSEIPSDTGMVMYYWLEHERLKAALFAWCFFSQKVRQPLHFILEGNIHSKRGAWYSQEVTIAVLCFVYCFDQESKSQPKKHKPFSKLM